MSPLDFIHCAICKRDFHETANPQHTTANTTPADSWTTASNTSSIRFWLTECCHILCEYDMFPQGCPTNAEKMLHTCPKCKSENASIIPLSTEASCTLPAKIATYFRPVDDIVDDLASAIKFQHQNMASLVKHLRSRVSSQQKVLDNAKVELQSLKQMKLRIDQLEKENQQLHLQARQSMIPATAIPSSKSIQEISPIDRPPGPPLKRKAPGSNGPPSSPFFPDSSPQKGIPPQVIGSPSPINSKFQKYAYTDTRSRSPGTACTLYSASDMPGTPQSSLRQSPRALGSSYNAFNMPATPHSSHRQPMNGNMHMSAPPLSRGMPSPARYLNTNVHITRQTSNNAGMQPPTHLQNFLSTPSRSYGNTNPLTTTRRPPTFSAPALYNTRRQQPFLTPQLKNPSLPVAPSLQRSMSARSPFAITDMNTLPSSQTPGYVSSAPNRRTSLQSPFPLSNARQRQ